MGALLVDDGGFAVAVGDQFQDALDVGAAGAAGELAVAEGACASFAEQVVAFGVESAAGVELADVGHAVLDSAAAFEERGAVPGEGEKVGGEEAGGAGADDDRAVGQGLRAGLGPVEVGGDEGGDGGAQAVGDGLSRPGRAVRPRRSRRSGSRRGCGRRGFCAGCASV